MNKNKKEKALRLCAKIERELRFINSFLTNLKQELILTEGNIAGARGIYKEMMQKAWFYDGLRDKVCKIAGIRYNTSVWTSADIVAAIKFFEYGRH